MSQLGTFLGQKFSTLQTRLETLGPKIDQAQGTADDAIDDAATALRGVDLLKDRVDALSAVATLKGSVDTYADLPDVAGHNEGDTYVVEADETHGGQTSLYTATDDNVTLTWAYAGKFTVDLEANVAGTQIVFLSETGDDSTGRVGTPLKPYRSWNSAWNPNVDVLVCGRGTFAVTSTKRLFIKGTRSTLIQRQNDFSIGGDYLIVVGP
ncbi:MAG: hypothetical protein LBK60_06350, partial [Verrucomicrobiales bacterium]|nr:hypothetical protein [Verrucomicrobiales bacterium]